MTMAMPRIVVVMGVSASGKSTFGKMLAQTLNYTFLEGDEFHPAANIAAMAAGKPLTDEERYPWLDAISRAIATTVESARGVVASCSALKRQYRERLGQSADVFFVYLAVDEDLARTRMASRGVHFMNPLLVNSQFETLEPLEDDEPGIGLDGRADLVTLVSLASERLAQSGMPMRSAIDE